MSVRIGRVKRAVTLESVMTDSEMGGTSKYCDPLRPGPHPSMWEGLSALPLAAGSRKGPIDRLEWLT